MQSLETITRLYEACGFQARKFSCFRMLGLGAKDVGENLEDEVGEAPTSSHNDIAFERKMWRTRKVTKLISLLPFVRAVAICNSLGFQMVHEDSDIDLFIVAAPGRVWSARWWVTGVLALLRLRPGEARRDPICVSFFIDESVEDLSELMIERDVYFHYWLRALMPVFESHILFERGAQAAPEFRIEQGENLKKLQKIFESCAKIFSESWVKTQQLTLMPNSLRIRAAAEDTDVVLSDTIIKLHNNDRRAELRDKVFE
ncbi:MAG: hypothetical protein NT003_05005 [Candidatus Magasanikbacteria bacterium]|nr:hypothetical protein [Candidatus Magasanikbacteria bacterium]